MIINKSTLITIDPAHRWQLMPSAAGPRTHPPESQNWWRAWELLHGFNLTSLARIDADYTCNESINIISEVKA
tara:strand:+ start:275 stop:493 length:219 start_codon:yes stop_codon:yes gene_type:complete